MIDSRSASRLALFGAILAANPAAAASDGPGAKHDIGSVVANERPAKDQPDSGPNPDAPKAGTVASKISWVRAYHDGLILIKLADQVDTGCGGLNGYYAARPGSAGARSMLSFALAAKASAATVSIYCTTSFVAGGSFNEIYYIDMQ
jgi:hypothetical protein